MIDTLSIEYIFHDKTLYDKCYKIIDEISAQNHMRIHKSKKMLDRKSYVTTSFQSYGLLEIKFFKYEFGPAIRILLKPSRLLYPNSHLHLSSHQDFAEIEKRFNCIIDSINKQPDLFILPHLANWKVMRIDYAFDIYTPHTKTYLEIFHSSFIPKCFKSPLPYSTSFYMKSKRTVYNFYDKIDQVKSKHGYDDSDIIKELGYLPDGILRLEIQCKCKSISYIKKKYGLKDSSINSLWNLSVALDVLKSRVKAVIGKEDFFPYRDCNSTLFCSYNERTYNACKNIIYIAKDSDSPTSLQSIKNLYHSEHKKAYFNYLIYKIRKAGINPIPLDRFFKEDSICILKNPYNILDSMEDGTKEASQENHSPEKPQY